MKFRRRSAHAALPAFLKTAESVDAAQRALLAAVPTPRDDGIPLADAIATFQRRLDQADALMPLWAAAGIEDLHLRCGRALVAARTEADRLRLEPKPLNFESLNTRLGDVLHPLEEFADAEKALRRPGR